MIITANPKVSGDCIWCDDGTPAEPGDQLCHFCRRGPRADCACGCCSTYRVHAAERLAKRRAEEADKAEQIGSLRKILRDHVEDFHRPWPGLDFAKTHFGNMVLNALERLGCDRAIEMQRATEGLSCAARSGSVRRRRCPARSRCTSAA